MTLTADERSAINRRNALKGSGPKTDEGKAQSRRNALKHGLRAETVALPHEDPEAIAARARAWDEHYRPDSPAAHHLVNECVRATLLADRCQRHHDAALTRQVRDAELDWDRARDDEVDRLIDLLKTDPAAAVRGLKRTGHGCRWLIARWEGLRAELVAQGQWHGDDCDDAVRLSGFRPEVEFLKQSPPSYLTRLFNHLCRVRPDEHYLEWLCHPARMPETFRALYNVHCYPDREDCQGLLLDMVDREIAALRPVEACLRENVDEPDRAGAIDRASVLRDPDESRLFLRYHAESRTSFHRAFKELTKVLASDEPAEEEAGTAAEVTGGESPSESHSSEVEPPNEPKPAVWLAPEARETTAGDGAAALLSGSSRPSHPDESPEPRRPAGSESGCSEYRGPGHPEAPEPPNEPKPAEWPGRYDPGPSAGDGAQALPSGTSCPGHLTVQ